MMTYCSNFCNIFNWCFRCNK